MEVPDPLAARDVYGDSNAGSDEEAEEALSLCDMPIYDDDLSAEWESALRDSNTGSSEAEDFDFEFWRPNLTANQTRPADDLFHQGRLLPLALRTSPRKSASTSASRCENPFLSNKRHSQSQSQSQAWRSDSVDSQSSTWTTSSSNNSQGSHKMKYYSTRQNISRPADNSAARKSQSRSNPPSASKTSLKWQLFTLGLFRTPPMKMEEIRLRQGKPNLEKSVIKRSVSCNYEEAPVLAVKEPTALNFQQKSKNMWIVKTPRRILVRLKSLNSCKASSVINCSIAMKPADCGVLAERRKPASPATKSLPLDYDDQSSLNLARRGPSKLTASHHLSQFGLEGNSISVQ